MKKLFVLLTAVVFIVGCFAIPASAASATVSAPAIVNAGQDVTVTVTIPTGLSKALSMGVAVTYNDDVFTVKSGPDASWMFGPSGVENQANGNWMANDFINGESIDGKVLTFTFTCNETAIAGTYSFAVAFNETYDPAGNPISILGGAANVTVIVPQIAVTGVTLDKTVASVNVGSTTSLTATVAPENATNKKVTFVSSDPTVAAVDSVTGVVTGIKEGTATITATTEDGGKTAACVVTVTCVHNFNKKDETNATALKEEGNCSKATVYYYFCSVCGARGGDTNTYETEKVADKHTSTQQLAEDKYLVAGSGADCKSYKEYYYACVECLAATNQKWTSTVAGEHNYGELKQAQPEVHTEDELKPAVAAYYQCSVCSNYFTEAKVQTDLEALTSKTPEHTYGEYVSDAQNHWKVCSCGKKDFVGTHAFDNDTDMICDDCTYDRSCTHPKALEHVAKQDAKCTEVGNIEYWYCPDCLAKFDAAAGGNKIVVTEIPVLGHKFAETFTFEDGKHWKICTNANCIEKSENANCSGGKKTCQSGAVCEICKNTYTGVGDHDYATAYTTENGSHWRACQTENCTVTTDNAACAGGTATCYKLAECATCGKEYGELKAHVISTTFDYKDKDGHAYACTNEGCTYHEGIKDHVDDAAGEKCTVCGYIYHTCGGAEATYVSAVIGNCMIKGRQAYYKCSCGKFYKDAAATELINSLSDIEFYGAHAGVVTPAIPATCTTNGMTQSMSCSVCRMQFMVAQTIPALGHAWGEWTTTLEPTEFAEGSKSRTCANCNETETAAIPALGHEHTVVELPAVDATCTATGLTAGSKCETCGEIIKAQEEVAMIAHATAKVDAKAATATEDGNVEYWTCSTCAGIWLDEQLTAVATKEETVIPATGEVVIEIPSTEEGGEATVIVSGTGIAAGTKLEVTYKPVEEFAHVSVTVEGKKGNIKQVVDINLQLDGNKVQPDGSVQVKLYIDAELRNIENLGIVYIAEDGTFEIIETERQGNYLVFNTNHFSNYAVIELTAVPEETTAPEETTVAPEETTVAPEETTAAPEETTEAPEETTEAPEDITVPEETTSPEVPSTGDNAVFFIVAIIAMATVFTVVVSLKKKRNDN